MPGERIEQCPRLRAEKPPAATTLVIRGGRDTPEKLRGHAHRTARAWLLDGRPLLGISVFAVLDEPLDDLLGRRFATFRTIYLPTVGRLDTYGFELLPTAQRPHFTVRLHSADDPELKHLLEALGVPQPNPAYPWERDLEGRTDMYLVDISADLNDEDETGYVWTFLDEAREPARITPGALVVAGDEEAAAVCQVVDLVPAADGTIVHLRLLPGLVDDYRALVDRALAS
ncbi:MAG TPA: hypothetical protein VFX25_26195 [Streptosporangiaceae bacterium]|nr:hypothetical protein [Streptosporangiaceae bacterium]